MALSTPRVIASVALSLICAINAHGQTLAAGQKHSVMLTSSGTVWTVGGNADGQLGDNTTTTRKVPILVSGLTNVSAVAAGFNHSLALKTDGTLWAWGDNAYGQLGDGSTTDRKVPVQITTLSSVVAMAAGQYHSVAVTASGQVYTWGRNANGQLGTGNTTNASTPVQMLSSGGASVGAGNLHTLVVKSDGTVWGAGYNGYGQLGIGNTTQQLSLVQMTGLAGATRADGGERFSVVLLADGTAKAAGYNSYGQLGDDTNTQRTTAVAVLGLTGATAIAVNEDHTLAVTSSGQVFAWGFNSNGQLGDGTTTERPTATLVTALPTVQGVAAGSTHSLAVTADGTLWAWGQNTYYQLGDGTTADRVLPDTISTAGFSWRVATPSFSVSAGTYTSDRNVVVTTETSGATIRYTRTGIEPTESDTMVASGGTVTVSETQTLMAKAWKVGMPSSATGSATYTMKVPIPTFSPSAGTFTSATTVSLSSSLSGVTFHYTVDGTVPTESSPTYTGPIPIGTTTSLKAIGRKTNWTTSDPRNGNYNMNFGTLAPPTIGPAAGTYEGQVSVTLSSPHSGATIRYTTNGSTPTSSSTAYAGPVPITTTSTLKAKVFHSDYATSAEASAAYTIKVPAPTLSLAPGTYAPGAEVTIVSPDAAATLHVTFTGADPVAADGVVASGTTLLVGGFTMKVRATRAGCVDSDVTTAAYALTEPLSAGALAAGAEYTVLATPQGLLHAWGRNTFGQIGDGSTTTRTAPSPVPSLTGVIRLAAGDSHTLALTWDGRVFAWGYNNNGRLGDGTTTNRSTPVLVPSLSGVVAIAAGGAHSLALTASGAVYAWGVGTSGQLGQGSTAAKQVPTLVQGLTGIVSIAAGESHSLALSSSGHLYAWGANSAGQLGDGTTLGKSSPVLVSGLTQVSAIRAGGMHTLARLHSGAVYVWGAGAQGQLGLGGTSNVAAPTLVTGLSTLDLEAGDLHSLGINTDGSMATWGDNADGKLGDGATTDRTAPFTLTSPTSVAFIAGGDDHSVAVTTDGHVWTWGGNTYGQLGDGTTTGQVAPHDVLTLAGTWGATPPPVLSLAPGTYDAPQAVTVSAGAGVTLRYTTTGSVPTETDPVIESGAIVEIDRTLTLTVKAWSATLAPSAPVVAMYQLQPPAPTASVPGGLYNAGQTVSLQGAVGVEIRYTLDGTVPSETSPLYESALTIAQTATLRARAFIPNWTPSAVLVAAYQIVVPVTSISLVAPAHGASVDPPVTVDLQAAVTSNVPITVTFFEGATALGTVSEAPYRLSWPAPGPGVYTLTATATDPFANITTATPVTLTVRTLPAISDVSPASGSAGTLLTISGTNFGETQGTSSLWLGTKVGVVETWTDGLITARIAAGASSGTVQVRLPDRVSNTLPVTVLTPVISNATPGSGAIGTAVTISGSNFGTGQGTGQVWLGTAAGVVTSWSESQIVATIAAGSQTGSVFVLQNGVASNAVPLTIGGEAPRITGLTPTQGGAGTVVTVYGSGFGSTQGGGAVRLGNGLAGVVSWSDSQVQVSIPTGAVSGVVKLQQGGLWSNAVMFRVPASAMGSASMISPVAVSLVVGESRTLQALDDDGELVTGATWTSSDTDMVSLSTADPPVLTAVAPGTVTISVGGASSEVTVYAGPGLPLGAVIWTNGASTAGGLYPAVPNYDAVADVFALGANDEVTAITADGSTAWTHQGLNVRDLYPDFQGGVVVRADGDTLWRLDPLTGAPLHLFSYASPEGQSYGDATPRVHPDGTVFVIDYTCSSTDCWDGTDPETGAWVVGINSQTAATKFRVKLQNSTDVVDTTEADELFCQVTGGQQAPHAWVHYPWAPIIAGDGNYYVPYHRYQATGTLSRSAAQVYPDAAYDLFDQLRESVIDSEFAAALAAHAALRAATGESYSPWDSSLDAALNNGASGRTTALDLLNQHFFKYKRLCDRSFTWTERLHMMRVGPDGTSTDITVKTWESSFSSKFHLETGPLAPWGYRESESYAGQSTPVVTNPTLITDADQGVLMSWISDERCPSPQPEVLVLTNTCVATKDEHLTLLTNGALVSDVVWGHSDWHVPVQPVLQLEDGLFVGTRHATGGGDTSVAFDALGKIKWELPGLEPTYALNGGGVSSGIYEFDADGVLVELTTPMPVQAAWDGRGYVDSNGVVERTLNVRPQWATTYASMASGNPGTVGTHILFASSFNGRPVAILSDYGGGCQLATGGASFVPPPTLFQGSPYANTVFETARDSVVASQFINNASPSSAICKALLNHIDLVENFADLEPRVQNLVPWDGSKTKHSLASLGLLNSDVPLKDQWAYNKVPVCALFVDRDDIHAVAQARDLPGAANPPFAGPRLNIYVTTTVTPTGNPAAPLKQAVDEVEPSTIVHEALHSLTSLDDNDLAYEFSKYITGDSAWFYKQASGGNTALLSDELEKASCAPR